MKKNEMYILRLWLVISCFGLSWLFYKDLSKDSQLSAKTIDVERINVREADGTLRMVISNKKNQHSGVIDGHSAKRERPAGMLFFNELGDEVGGLVYAGTTKENAGGSFTFDRWKNDQVIQLRYSEYKGEQYTGLIVSDRIV